MKAVVSTLMIVEACGKYRGAAFDLVGDSASWVPRRAVVVKPGKSEAVSEDFRVFVAFDFTFDFTLHLVP
jgi:hypothetical protein